MHGKVAPLNRLLVQEHWGEDAKVNGEPVRPVPSGSRIVYAREKVPIDRLPLEG